MYAVSCAQRIGCSREQLDQVKAMAENVEWVDSADPVSETRSELDEIVRLAVEVELRWRTESSDELSAWLSGASNKFPSKLTSAMLGVVSMVFPLKMSS